METEIPEQARRFIARHVVSATQLEILLLLRAARDRDWTADEVARAQVMAPGAAQQILEDLQARQLLEDRDGEPRRYRYRPSTSDGTAIESLARAYAARRIRVLELIFSKPSSAG